MKKIQSFTTGLSIVILAVFCVVFAVDSSTLEVEGYGGLVPNASKVGIEVDLGIPHDFICEESDISVLGVNLEEVISPSKGLAEPGPVLVRDIKINCHNCHVNNQSYALHKTLKVPWRSLLT